MRKLGSLSPSTLKERSIRGGVVTIGAQVMSQAMTVVSVAVLARLLTPDDYGSVAMVVALTSFLNVFREMGLSGATIQKQSLSHSQVSKLFLVNVGLGALIMLVTMACAPLIAWFYGKPHLSWITLGLAFGSLLGSLGTQHAALLNRQMRFRTLAAVQLSSLVAGFSAAVAVALLGGKYWALVANNLVGTSWSTVGLWLVSGFRPTRPVKGTGIKDLLHFGTRIAAADVIAYFRLNVDHIAIGRAFGAQTLGLYDKAFSLMHVPFASLKAPLNKVAFPAMSALAGDPPLFRAYFRKYCAVLAFATMPLVAFMYASADRIIHLLLGDRWMGTAELFQILGIAVFIDAVGNLRITVMVATGHGNRLVQWGLLSTAAKVAALVIGLPWGVNGVAVALVALSYVSFHPFTAFALRGTPLRVTDFYKAMALPAMASLAMFAAYRLVCAPLVQWPDLAVLAAAVPVCALTYLGVFAALPGGGRALREYLHYCAFLLPHWLTAWRHTTEDRARIGQ